MLGRRKEVNRTLPAQQASSARMLEVIDLHTSFKTPKGLVKAVDGVSFTLDRGKTLGVVGESGSGKTILSRSIMGLLPGRNVEREGSVLLEGNEISTVSADRDARVLGLRDGDGVPGPDDLAQPGHEDRPPDHRVAHATTSTCRASQADATALALLQSVGIPEPERRLGEYPHQLSGGMRQRVTIAIALACGPKLLFADEPTTALDVTVQAQILNLLQQQQRERHMAMILVTHDLGVVAGRTDDIAVMYAGQDRREGADPHALRPHEHALHRGAAEVDPQARQAEPQPPRDHRRPSARPGQPAEGLQVRTPLPVRAGQVPRGGAAAGRGRDPRPLLPLLVPGRHRRRPRSARTQPRRPRAADRGRVGRRRRAGRQDRDRHRQRSRSAPMPSRSPRPRPRRNPPVEN